MPFKIVISDPKTRKAYQKEAEEAGSGLIGRKVGEKVSADFLGLSGYEVEITGGSDRDGFPMRKDVDGIGRKRILLSSGIGFHAKINGQRRRKSIRGNTISAQVAQINVKITKWGQKSIEELFGIKTDDKPKEEKEMTENEKREKKAGEVEKIREGLEKGATEKKPEQEKE